MKFRKQTPGKRTPRQYDEARLYEYAVGALARRMRTVAEIKRLMRTRVAHQPDGDDLVEKVTSRLKDQRYLNDSAYAAHYTAYRRDTEKFGAMRVVQDLKARGVHGDIISRAVPEAYSGVNDEEQARAFLKRKRVSQPRNQREAARIFRLMTRAGFATRTIFPILRNWQVEEEVLSALEQERTAADERSTAADGGDE